MSRYHKVPTNESIECERIKQKNESEKIGVHLIIVQRP